MKRIWSSIALILVLVFSLVGCGNSSAVSSSSKNGTTSEKNSNEKVTLTIMTHYSDQQEANLMKYINMWNKDHPNIQVKHKSVDFDQLLPTIMAQQTSGQVADIIHIYSLWGGQLNSSHVLAPPPADVKSDIENNYKDAAIKSSTVDGQLLGYPTEIETYALFYNKKLLKAAGYDHPPKTWDEMYQMAQKITQKDSKGKMKVEGFGLMSGWDSAVVHPYLSLLYSNGGSFLNADKSQAELNTSAAKETLNYEMKYFNSGITDSSFSVLKAFPSEQLAMTINAGWWLGSLKAAMKDNFKDVGVAPIPSPDGTTNGSISYGFLYGVNSRSAHQKEAWEFLKWLNSQPVENNATGESNFLVSQGIIPTRNSDITALSSEMASDNYKPFIDALSYAKPEPNLFQGQKIKTDLQKEIEKVWSKQESVDQGLQNVNNVINQELK